MGCSRRPGPDDFVAEIRAQSVRSLVTFQPDLWFLRQVPQIEFLFVSRDPNDVGRIHDLRYLRTLSFSWAWSGRLNFTAFPRLESFEAMECPKDGGLDTLFSGHPALSSIGIGRYRFEDLAPLAGLRLRELALSGNLTSLAGAGAMSGTLERLTLDSAPMLTSLDGIEHLARLEVVKIDGLRHITTVDWAARLLHLRLLDIFMICQPTIRPGPNTPPWYSAERLAAPTPSAPPQLTSRHRLSRRRGEVETARDDRLADRNGHVLLQ